MWLRAPKLNAIAGVRHGFTTRFGGRAAFGPTASWDFALNAPDRPAHLGALNAGLGRATDAPVVESAQPHGTDVAWVDDAPPPACDGLLTATAGQAVAVRTADCAPILLAATLGSGAPVVGAIHAGWRGAVAGIVHRTADALFARGVSAGSIRVAIGPHIRAAHFEVGPEVHEALVAHEGPERAGAVLHTRGQRRYLDLTALLRSQWMAQGLGTEQIDIVPGCTYEHPSLFYSYRRATHRGEPNPGRLLAVIAICHD